MTDTENVRRIALSLPEVTQSGSGFAIREKGFAWYYQEKIEGRKGRVEHLDVLAVRVADLVEKDVFLAMDSEKFFTDAHYRGYPAILVRLAAVDTDELIELLTNAWRHRAPRKLVARFGADSLSITTECIAEVPSE